MSESTVNDVTEEDFMLTTIDNPYNPKVDYDKWKNWDEDNGYYTESFIGRLLLMEEDFDVDDEVKMIQLQDKVIHDIVEHDMTKMYKLV